MVVIFLLEDFSLLLVKINHLLLTSDPETNENELWITSALSCSPSKATAAPTIRSCKKTYLNLSMASTAPCLCSSSFGGGGSLPSLPSLLPFSLPPFFFFPGIASSLFDGCSATIIHHTQNCRRRSLPVVGKPALLRMRNTLAQHSHKDRRKWRLTHQEQAMALQRKG